jgi:hypothetical protein
VYNHLIVILTNMPFISIKNKNGNIFKCNKDLIKHIEYNTGLKKRTTIVTYIDGTTLTIPCSQKHRKGLPNF